MATTTTSVGAPTKPGELLSERIAPGILPKVLGRFDMIAIFVAIVLFAVQGSVVQPAGASAFVYWILGFVTFLIPGAIVTGQLGLMFPGEGSIYVWTNKALGSFWGFFAGFCAWWPGTLVMVATAVLVVNLLQFFMSLPPFNVQNPLGALWQQGIIILAVIWFSSGLSILRFRVTQNLVNGVFVIYGAAILAVGLAGLAWLLGGHPAANDFSRNAFGLNAGNATFYGLVILALLGIEVPLNMGVEIRDRKAITSYLIWGSVVVMAAYLLLTFGAMVVVPQKDANSTYAILQAVQNSLGAGAAVVVTLVMIAFFIFNTTVYNYSFAPLPLLQRPGRAPAGHHGPRQSQQGAAHRRPDASGHHDDHHRDRVLHLLRQCEPIHRYLYHTAVGGHGDLVPLDGVPLRGRLDHPIEVPGGVQARAAGAGWRLLGGLPLGRRREWGRRPRDAHRRPDL